MNDAQRDTLEGIRQQFAPIFDGLGAKGIGRDDIVIAWPFTTQDTTATLQALGQQTSGRPITAVATGLTTAQLLSGAAATGDVYVGSTTVPYYLDAPSNGNPAAPMTTFWAADPAHPAAGGTMAPAGAPCSALAPSLSTTRCYPQPLLRSEQRIPVILTIPNAASGRTMPASGWPVVIFQHGITGNRTQMLAVAPALAAAGFASIAIDLPLHGLPPGNVLHAVTDGFPEGLRPIERTFDLDVLDNDSGAPGADGRPDGYAPPHHA